MDKIVLIDNYDSFTYNLVHLFYEVLGYEITVVKNDQVTVEEIGEYDKIILSPGPGIPDEAGITKAVIAEYAGKKPILGVCLGLQSIAEVFGAKLKNLPQVYHGIQTSIQMTENTSILYNGIEEEIQVGRYHSWAIDETTVPENITVTSVDATGEIMSIEHSDYPVYGVQYHPESILTPLGKQIISNFLSHNS